MAAFPVPPPGGLPPQQRPSDAPPPFGHVPVPVAPAPGYDPQQPPRAQQKKQGILGAIGVALVALAKYKFVLLTLLKTGGTMLLSIWLWAQLYGWPFAAGFVILIFVHEMGHVIAAKMLGMPVSAPLFIPFAGAAIYLKENPRDAWSEALMAYGGPLAGCLGGWACYWLAAEINAPWLMAVAASTFFMNLFNLLPVPPLDGGRICAAVSTWFWIFGLILLAVTIFYFHAGIASVWNFSPVFALIWVGVIASIFLAAVTRISQTFRQRGTPEMRAYYNIGIASRLLMAALYIGLIAVLGYGYLQATLSLRTG